VSATNKELRAAVAEGRFREDLYFRLHVVPLHVPPLRERAEDIPLLTEAFLERHRRRSGLRPPRLTPAALELLVAHPWPGNVRELANLLERLAILHAGASVGAAELRPLLSPLAGSSASAPAAGEGALTELLDGYERTLIEGALEGARGSVAEAARRLRTDRANLYRRMKRLGVER
jgi:two-component system, NtrC family, nitrogen regulation response regulator NtrX